MLKNKTEVELLSTMDATIWADEWLKTIEKHTQIPTDRGTMIGWFANSIMVGYDAGRKAGENLVVDTGLNSCSV